MAWKRLESPARGTEAKAWLSEAPGNSPLVGDVKPKGSTSAVLGLRGVMWNSVDRGDIGSSGTLLSLPNTSLGN